MGFFRRSGFPVGVEVDRVYLSRITYSPRKHDKKYESVLLFFKRGSQSLRDVVVFPQEKDYDTSEQFLSAMASRKAILERIGITYLGREVMSEINRNARGIDEYVEYMVEELKDIEFWDIEVVIKTTRDSNGYIKIGKYTQFIKRADDEETKLEYDEFEKNNVEKYENKSENRSYETDNVFK